MLFLIESNRNRGRIVTPKAFNDSARQKAEDSRLEIELALNRRGIKHEIVLLESATEEALRRTHRRYFEDVDELMKSPHGINE